MDVTVPKLVFAVHVLVGALFLGGAGQFLLAGEPVGAVLQGAIGIMVILVGRAAARIVARRQ